MANVVVIQGQYIFTFCLQFIITRKDLTYLQKSLDVYDTDNPITYTYIEFYSVYTKYQNFFK